MKLSEILRLVWINLIQNKFKVVLTSIGIVVGAATIVMVIAIGRGGQMDVADQFKNLNAGAIDISYEQSTDSSSSNSKGSSKSGSTNKSSGENSESKGNQGDPGGFGGGQWMPQMPGGGMQGGGFGGFMAGGNNNNDSSKINQEKITLSEDDMDDLKTFLPGISDITISYTTKSEVDGGDLDEAESYTIAGVKNNYASMSNLTMAAGSFIESSNETNKEKVCVLGYSVAKEIFGSVEDAYDSTIYIDNRAYVVNGVISEVGTVSSGISPDDSIFIPYNTGVKYIVGTDVNPTITVMASDVDNVDNVMENIQSVLAENYPNAEFTITDAGSKMEAASESNNTLTTLLIAMAAIVFIVGGIGIMNVLFVSVKERTKEIGILKAIGCTKKDILIEFLLEACFISILGGILGVLLSFGITPIVEYFDVRVELSVAGAVLAVVFAIFTGTVFGFYPALKASKLVPVEALNEE
ncbi:ABC transporter permease [Butyribacter sp.]|uniref:ABC transporter permease n=1 Tax=Butyribacter sp. TaxID=2822465 RepID=UPI002A96B624|nr:ABC transporter permease [Butyribacter sp.]